MKKTYAYARISTVKQDIQRQVRNIKEKYPEATIFEETFTGTTTARPELQNLISRIEKDIKKGNQVVLIFDEISRMSRNAEEGYELYQKLFDMGVELHFIKEPYLDTATIKETLEKRISLTVETGNTATDNFISGMINLLNQFAMDMVKENIKAAFSVAQAEVEYLHKRTSEGVRRAIAQGKQVGREEGTTLLTAKSQKAMGIIKKHSKSFGGTLSDVECMKLLKNDKLCSSRNTYYKLKKILESYCE